MAFQFTKLSIPDVLLVEGSSFGDERGFFMEIYKYSDFQKAGIIEPFTQDNYSRSAKNVLRGLHYQANPRAQGKLVRAIRGKVFDVAVDIRRGSPTFGKWVAEELSEQNKKALWIPVGFAHGFVALEDNTELYYKVTDEYAPETDRGILWDDPVIGIQWPAKDPALSPKDVALPILSKAIDLFTYKSKEK